MSSTSSDLVPEPEPDWRTRALCRTGSGYDPDIWFPDPQDHATRRKAEQICATCPVTAECLAAADEARERFGVWAGMERTDIGTAMARRLGRGRPTATGVGCGTPKGFRDHLKRDERPCQPCRDAANEAYADKYAKSLAAVTGRRRP